MSKQSNSSYNNSTPQKVNLFGTCLAALEAAPLCTIYFDDDDNIVKGNPAAFDLFDCTNIDELQACFYKGDSKSLIKEKLAECYKEGCAGFECQFTTLNGKCFFTEITPFTLLEKHEGTNAVKLAFLKDFCPVQEQEKIFEKRMLAILDATPLCLNLWNHNFNNIMCNKKAVELFGLNNNQEYLDNFFKLSPERQPDGRLSSEVAITYIRQAFETGHANFMWMHCKLTGEEIPSEITLIKINVADVDGHALVAGFTRDLRSQLAGLSSDEHIDGYIFNHISDRQLFNSLAELTDELFYVLNNKTSYIQYFGKGRELFGLTSEQELFPDKILASGKVYKEDVEPFKELANAMIKGVSVPNDVRLIPSNDIPHFYRFTYNTLLGADGTPMFTIGKAVDIHEQILLEKKSQTDLLTKCYNKITSEKLITSIINKRPDCSHAMFIIDIDDFKSINDNLGHHFGDLVLSEVASNLRACFRNADIVGRIGGDEFIVFLSGVDDIGIITKKAEKIAKAFQNTYSGENNDYKISGSIGISRYPNDGDAYEDLYKCADKALYQSKLRGKDCFTFYSKKLLDGTMKNRTMLENASRVANSYFDSELVSTVFNLMFETKELRSSVNAVMQFIGKRTNSDRCYIFETSDGGKTYDNTYEWCAAGINPEIDNLQGLTAEILADFFNTSDDNGVLYCNDLKELVAEGAFELMNDQGIKSFLHAQVVEKDSVKLFLGLDDCTNTRVWNEKEINSVLYATKMISIFLLSDKNKA